MAQATKTDEVITRIGSRVRAAREQRGWSRKLLAERSGVSERFLGELEAGRGNISVRRLGDVGRALGLPLDELVSHRSPRVVDLMRRIDALDGKALTLVESLVDGGASDTPAGARHLALLGVRGAGKSTVGAQVAERLGRPFVELDQRIEQEAGLSLGQIFLIHGEAYYRQLEYEALRKLLRSSEPVVVATGGSLVTHHETWALLRQSARTVWLHAQAQDLWDRVIAQGDRRPMRENPQAFSQLESLLAEREPLYGQADGTVETSGMGLVEVIDSVLKIEVAPGS